LQKRGRKTLGELGGVTLNVEQIRLQPPAHLNAAERQLFVELVELAPPRQFTPTDSPLLCAYVQAIVLSRGAVRNIETDPHALSIWEKAIRMQAVLATKLRLCPHSRAHARTIEAHTRALPSRSVYDELRLSAEDGDGE